MQQQNTAYSTEASKRILLPSYIVRNQDIESSNENYGGW